MKCIVEVISDTLSKPSPLPISQECLETLRGDERIISILRHQNLLKELQELAVQGASERTWQQKKNSGFEDELSEVLENQNDKNMQREKSQQNSEGEESKENENSRLEDREPRSREAGPEDDKKNAEESESSELSEAEESPGADTLDNHISDSLRKDELSEHKLQGSEEGQPEGTSRSQELQEEKKQEESQGEEEETLREHTEEEDDGRSTLEDEHPTEADRIPGLAEDEIPREGGGRYHSEDEAMQAEDTFQSREIKREEVEEEPSKEWEDSKRWNKMDELGRQLTSKKSIEENDSGEEPDRSMKMSYRSHKYNFHNPEEDMRRSWKHHGKEDSSEGGFPLAAMPEEKKDEEGSANRRTEDQELESLAAIEAELEKVAHKIHELRRG
uniref:Chromogranin-A n=1 Tax=Pelusios castaneus TaxID=367368 RepID=A0A8C8S061_9SAUR